MHQWNLSTICPFPPSLPSGMLFPNIASKRSLTWHAVHIASNKTTPVLLSENQTSKPRPQYQAPELFSSRPQITASINRLIPANAQHSSQSTKAEPIRLDSSQPCLAIKLTLLRQFPSIRPRIHLRLDYGTPNRTGNPPPSSRRLNNLASKELLSPGRDDLQRKSHRRIPEIGTGAVRQHAE